MDVLIVGSGGREHALAAAIAGSPLCGALHAAPGNPGIAAVARCHPVAAADVDGLVALAHDLAVELVVVGPEVALVAGLADALRHAGIATFGPGAAGARLEGSKAFAKEVMLSAGVPTARGLTAITAEEALAAIATLGGRVVVKADGLAAGKGVIVCDDTTQAESAVATLAGQPLVIEERLDGVEVSLLALCHGEVAVALPPARDAKPLFDDDQGPNTGGMGACSPVAGLDAATVDALVASIHVPVLRELARRGVSFSGCLYAGLMLTADGPRVLEFNTRFGDPETQAVVPRIAEDLLTVLHATAVGTLEQRPLAVHPGGSVAVVLAAAGYPDTPRAGDEITGVADAADLADIYHAGTALRNGRLVTAGGRVLAVSAVGPSVDDAGRTVYEALARITFTGMQWRSDIAARAGTLPGQ